jgi:hypothetical protein
MVRVPGYTTEMCCDFVVSAYRLSTSKVTLSVVNNHSLPGLDRSLKQAKATKTVTRNPAPVYKTAVSWVWNIIRKMAHRKTLNGGKRKSGPAASCEVFHDGGWTKGTKRY